MSATKTDHACFARVDGLLAERGYRLDSPITLQGGPRRVCVATEPIGGRVRVGKARAPSALLVATFCPFCGKKLE